MNRRGFFEALVGAAVASRVPVSERFEVVLGGNSAIAQPCNHDLDLDGRWIVPRITFETLPPVDTFTGRR